MRTSFLLRWSARELRRRWIQVGVIALIIAVGTGVYAGLGSTSAWRRRSNDESYAMLRMYDVRVALSDGSFVPGGSLEDTLQRLQAEGWIAEAEERLVAPTQVDASGRRRTILVPGRIVGVDVSAGGPHVNGIDVTAGRRLSAADDGRSVAILEAHFADHYALPPNGRLGLPGGASIGYVGTGYSPEYFMVVTEGGAFMAEASFAVLFAPLGTAQAVTGHGGDVNDLVVRLAPGVGVAEGRSAVEAAVRDALPGLGVTVTASHDDVAHRVLYEDIETDQRFWNVIAYLILAGAVFAAFNLTSRIVESTRREIGTAMALGQPRWRIALRPLLMGAEIAVLGVAFGVLVGLLVMQGLRSLFVDMLPLPVWRTEFQPWIFARGAALGFALPFLGTVWPVWRAVRVPAVDAIRTGHLAARGGGLAPVLRRVRIPGGTFGQMPIRNALRAQRRTLLTALGIGAAITALVGTMGMLDSFTATIDRGEAEITTAGAARMDVNLASFVSTDSPPFRAIRSSPAVVEVSPMLRVGATVSSDSDAFDVSIELVDRDGSVWWPSLSIEVVRGPEPGIFLAEEAAGDLGVVPGQHVTVEHPVRRGETSFGVARTRMRVLGVHAIPMRMLAYMDTSDADVMGLAGFANAAQVLPSPGTSRDELTRGMFALPGVASAQPITATVEAFRDVIDQFVRILGLIEVFALALVVLIAFNAAAISADERRREHATMLAFGVRIRTLLRISSIEGFLIGVVGTAIGLGLGALVLRWLISGVAAETVPDIGIVTSLAPATILSAFALGVVAVGLAPLLTARRVSRMDVPSMLRVLE